MFDLGPYNSFGMRIHAKKGVIIDDVSQLRRVNEDNIIILGNGSDVLFTDDYEGTVLINRIKNLEVENSGDDFIVRAGAGLVLDELIAGLLKENIYGLENLSAIPGTVGATPIQNVGAYGVEIGDFITEVHVYDLQRHFIEIFDKELCQFAYRSSYFKTHRERKLLITQVVFKLSSHFSPILTYGGLNGKPFTSAMELREHIISLRTAKLPNPNIVGNAGSFFKNPIVSKEIVDKIINKYENAPIYPVGEGKFKIAAGWLIEKAGCKGITHGNVGTWEKQALVIVNRGDAKPHEVVALAKYIIQEVASKFGIKLEPEVRTYNAYGEITWDKL